MSKKEPHSRHYDGKRFHNEQIKQRDHGIFGLLRWFLTRKSTKWPKLKIEQGEVPHRHVPKGKLQVTFVNHSTVLIQMDNLNILTDPIWSKRCGPFGLAGPKRVTLPGIRFEDLPPIDLVLVSHNHYDHMDIPTLRKLYRVHRPVFCVSRGNAALLHAKGLHKIYEFDWWEEKILFDHLKITFVPGQHFSRRGLWDRNKTLWGGFIIESSKGPVYFAGDTGYGPHFKEIYKKFGKIRFSMLPIGAYSPEWFMSPVHMSPEQAVQAHLDLHSVNSMAIHFGTFKLSDEAIFEPIVDLKQALPKHKVSPDHFWTLMAGETKEAE